MAVTGRTDFSNQRPSYSIIPPAITRHLVFRLSKDENPRWKSDGDRDASWDELADSFEAHVNSIREIYKAGKVDVVRPTENSDEEVRRYSLKRSALINGNVDPIADGYRLRIRLDVYTEVFSFTYIYDRLDPEKGTLIGKNVKWLYDPEMCRQASDWLLDGIWKDESVASAIDVERWWKNVSGKRLGAAVTDFRGILMCPRLDWPMGSPSLDPADTKSRSGKELDQDLSDFLKSHGDLIRHVAASNEPAAISSNQVIGGESVLCGMLEGKALYAAELGQWGGKIRSPAPIKHLLVYSGHSHAQLARLLRRLHVLGDLRHAAMMDYENVGERGDIKSASRKLRELGRKLDEIVAAWSPETTEVDDLTGCMKQMGEIGACGDGGLIYRVEQSRYYAQEFTNTLPHLRTIRIADWQPYDDFVKRYVYQLFARIDRVGKRYEAIGRRMDRLLFFKQTESLAVYQRTVGEALRNIRTATGALETSAQAQFDVSEKQKALLSNAELIALAVLGYYAGSATLELIKLQADAGWETAALAALVWVCALWLAFIALLGVVALDWFRSAAARRNRPSSIPMPTAAAPRQTNSGGFGKPTDEGDQNSKPK